MRIWIAAIGARPRESFEVLARMYLDRIGALLPGGTKTVLETPAFRSEQALLDAVERERARTSPLLVRLDERGRQMSSEVFASWFGGVRDSGRQLVIFAVGPADGWGDQAGLRENTGSRGRAAGAQRPDAMLLSLGPMTLPHELARVVLCEQVYRALTILSGHPYHRS